MQCVSFNLSGQLIKSSGGDCPFVLLSQTDYQNLSMSLSSSDIGLIFSAVAVLFATAFVGRLIFMQIYRSAVS